MVYEGKFALRLYRGLYFHGNVCSFTGTQAERSITGIQERQIEKNKPLAGLCCSLVQNSVRSTSVVGNCSPTRRGGEKRQRPSPILCSEQVSRIFFPQMKPLAREEGAWYGGDHVLHHFAKLPLECIQRCSCLALKNVQDWGVFCKLRREGALFARAAVVRFARKFPNRLFLPVLHDHKNVTSSLSQEIQTHLSLSEFSLTSSLT